VVLIGETLNKEERMADFQDYYKLPDCEILKSTGKAILILIPDFDKDPIWIPLSQVDDRSEIWKEGEKGELMISQWIAEQKGIA
jgi:hypothetical protein